MAILISSDAFAPQEFIPRKYTDDGENIPPPLTWGGLPPGTKQLALIVDDPDARMSEPFVHWVLYNIAPNAPGVPVVAALNSLAPPIPPQLCGMIEGLNSHGKIGYLGPSPPKGHGVHHYHFHLYALDVAIHAAEVLHRRALLAAMNGHIIEESELVGLYSR